MIVARFVLLFLLNVAVDALAGGNNPHHGLALAQPRRKIDERVDAFLTKICNEESQTNLHHCHKTLTQPLEAVRAIYCDCQYEIYDQCREEHHLGEWTTACSEQKTNYNECSAFTYDTLNACLDSGDSDSDSVISCAQAKLTMIRKPKSLAEPVEHSYPNLELRDVSASANVSASIPAITVTVTSLTSLPITSNPYTTTTTDILPLNISLTTSIALSSTSPILTSPSNVVSSISAILSSVSSDLRSASLLPTLNTSLTLPTATSSLFSLTTPISLNLSATFTASASVSISSGPGPVSLPNTTFSTLSLPGTKSGSFSVSAIATSASSTGAATITTNTGARSGTLFPSSNSTNPTVLPSGNSSLPTTSTTATSSSSSSSAQQSANPTDTGARSGTYLSTMSAPFSRNGTFPTTTPGLNSSTMTTGSMSSSAQVSANPTDTGARSGTYFSTATPPYSRNGSFPTTTFGLNSSITIISKTSHASISVPSGARSGTFSFPLTNSTIPSSAMTAPGNRTLPNTARTSSAGQGNRSGRFSTSTTTRTSTSTRTSTHVVSAGMTGTGLRVGPSFTSRGKVCSVVTRLVPVRTAV